MQGQGTIHAIDPFGLDFLSKYVWQTVGLLSRADQRTRLAMSGYNGEAKLPFWGTMASGGQLNNVDEKKHVTVPCSTVDDSCGCSMLPRVDLIKIDIEGGEEFLIEGMNKPSSKHRPQIAIAIYHTYHHLWSLPLRLMSLCPDYRFYLDHYGFKKWDTVSTRCRAEKVQPHYRTPSSPLLVLK